MATLAFACMEQLLHPSHAAGQDRGVSATGTSWPFRRYITHPINEQASPWLYPSCAWLSGSCTGVCWLRGRYPSLSFRLSYM
ncbi:hypothetical protein M433DRAFT_154133 [Acidomyces richmondensis BFW]|nr:MAG: hypothetical protein FE78DRAFT_90073 [Acidomyces sp. 'richmondensis']KYG45785.1 hypothetical protein M433DRAFT_154133 [Acidomyces richmondensis BFW]